MRQQKFKVGGDRCQDGGGGKQGGTGSQWGGGGPPHSGKPWRVLLLTMEQILDNFTFLQGRLGNKMNTNKIKLFNVRKHRDPKCDEVTPDKLDDQDEVLEQCRRRSALHKLGARQLQRTRRRTQPWRHEGYRVDRTVVLQYEVITVCLPACLSACLFKLPTGLLLAEFIQSEQSIMDPYWLMH